MEVDKNKCNTISCQQRAPLSIIGGSKKYMLVQRKWPKYDQLGLKSPYSTKNCLNDAPSCSKQNIPHSVHRISSYEMSSSLIRYIHCSPQTFRWILWLFWLSQNVCGMHFPDIKYVTGWSQGIYNARITGRNSCTSSRCLVKSHSKLGLILCRENILTPNALSQTPLAFGV